MSSKSLHKKKVFFIIYDNDNFGESYLILRVPNIFQIATWKLWIKGNEPYLNESEKTTIKYKM